MMKKTWIDPKYLLRDFVAASGFGGSICPLIRVDSRHWLRGCCRVQRQIEPPAYNSPLRGSLADFQAPTHHAAAHLVRVQVKEAFLQYQALAYQRRDPKYLSIEHSLGLD